MPVVHVDGGLFLFPLFLFGGDKVGDGGSPAAGVGRFFVASNEGMIVEQGADAATQRSRSFSMDDTNVHEALLVTRSQVFGHEAVDVRRIE